MGAANTSTLYEEAICAELEATREAFHALLAAIPDEAWEKAVGDGAWNVREVLYHIVFVYAAIPREVNVIRRGWWFPKPPAWLFDWFNALLVRWGARGQTKESIARKYEQAHRGNLNLLRQIGAEEWSKSTVYPDVDPYFRDEVSVAQLFRLHPDHFKRHAVEVQEALA